MKKKRNSLRTAVQIFFLVLIALIAVNHSLAESGRSIPVLSNASLHAVCPFGGVVSIYQLATTGTIVKKIHESSFVLMAIVAVLVVVFGPVFCGWICPMGTVQEFFSKIGKKIFRKKFNRFIPYQFDRWLRYLRYAVLAWVLYMTAVTGKIIFADYDPYYVLFNFWTGEVAVTGYIILGLTLLLSLFVERPFCKYACPYGAVLGLSNLFRIFPVKRSADTCISCGACDKACPMNIKVATAGNVRNHQCISCMKCTSETACPVENTVALRSVFKPEKVKAGSRFIAPAAVLLFVAGIGISMAAGYWQTENSKVPASYSSGEFEGEYNPADIRGSYSLGDIEEAFGIDVKVLAQAFGITAANLNDFQIKEFESMYVPLDDGSEVGTDSVRLFVARYLGLPYTPEDTTRLPSPAIAVLKEKLTPADIEALQAISVKMIDLKPADSEESPTAETVEHSETEEAVIKGKTTFNDLLDWGLSREEIEGVLGIEMGTRATAVRDYLAEKGLEFSEYKEGLQALIDAKIQ